MAYFQMYNTGLDSLRTWTTSTFQYLLMADGSTFDVDDAFVADVLAGGTEIGVVGYARQNVDAPVRTVSATNNRIEYACDDPDFGTLTTGETVVALVAYLFVTNDADSVPVGWLDLPATDTGAFDPFTITLQDGLAFFAYDGNS